ncbi:CheR family methyltransferase [Leptolyngbya ohadii]|uniref:CheR family methyltransferase n=1 Tax=Leptolyngbya ohadii TaxID=1962290 RepID=UPI000B59ECBF|nr:CheR family methyltransferase [Leptolyngbya ohadii]
MSNSPENLEFEALLDYIKRSRGFDFTGYKRPSLMRRVNKRMQAVGVEDYASYLDYLEVHPGEFNALFNTLLINVTAFFRDRLSWDYIRDTVVPQILSSKLPGAPIRVWSAGCASGQEAYTIAILLAEHLGLEQFRERVKIYATDVDEEALQQARQAIYSDRELVGLSPEQIEQFFERLDDYSNGEQRSSRFSFRKDLRRSVIFGRHDLVQDAPISKIDLLLCRNVLMYFNGEIQRRILSRFHFALRDSGFLFLGKAEMLLTYTSTFMPLSLRCRIFTKISQENSRNSIAFFSTADEEETVNALIDQEQIKEAAFDRSPIARIIIDTAGLLVLANECARGLFKLTAQDLQRPLQDLEISYRPLELRSCIDQVHRDRQPITVSDIEWLSSPGEPIYFDIQVTPLISADNVLIGVGVNFLDISRYKRLQQELEDSNQELELAYEELQSANEELETTNEELQSSNEELETTNEELQATNEELETMNEELQSTNEELQTVNDELQRRSEELNQANAFLESILTSLRGGVVVVDRGLCVQIWNHRAEDLWGLRPEEALGQNFLNLDIGLPVEQLRQPIRNCLAGLAKNTIELLQAVNRRGKGIECRVTCTPLVDMQDEIQGVILLMEEGE